jgi:type III secretion system FlhB-like substrate exporter
MASPVGYSDRRQQGLKRKTDYVDIGGGKIKRRVRMKGYNSNKATLLGDSLTQFMHDMINCSVQAIPGAYARDFIQMCRNEVYDLSSFPAIVLILGTNDVTDTIPTRIADIFQDIIEFIRHANPTCRLAISGILPRPCDSYTDDADDRQKALDLTNSLIKAVCKYNNVVFFNSETAIIDKGDVETIYHTDQLHLSFVGVGHLKNWLEGKIGSLMGVPPQWDPISKSIVPKKKSK